MKAIFPAQFLYKNACEVVRLRWLLFDLNAKCFATDEDLTLKGRRRLRKVIKKLDQRLEYLENLCAGNDGWYRLVGLAAAHIDEKDKPMCSPSFVDYFPDRYRSMAIMKAEAELSDFDEWAASQQAAQDLSFSDSFPF